MSEGIIGAIITGAFTLVGIFVSNRKSQREIEHKLETQQSVTDTKIDELTREVREHNNFARRMPVVEEQVERLTKDVSTLREYHMQ